MKRWFLLIVVAFLAFGAALTGSRFLTGHKEHTTALDSMPELAWLRRDLRLSDEQFQNVARLHAEYQPTCQRLCAKIGAARSRVQAAVKKEPRLTQELDDALMEQARVHAECQRAMVGHIYETAALLDEAQAARYLKTVLPHTLDLSAYSSLKDH